jgi:hypothetical protein
MARYAFPVRLSHPLLNAGLSRRSKLKHAPPRHTMTKSAVLLLCIALAGIAQSQPAPEQGLLFYLSGGHGLQADYAGGNPASNFWDDEAKALLSIRGSPPSQSAGCAIRRYAPAGRRPSLKTVDNCSCILAGSGRAKILRTVSSTG